MANGIGALVLEGCTFPQLLAKVGKYLVNGKPERGPSPSHRWEQENLKKLKKLTRMPVGRALPLYELKAAEFYQSRVKSYKEMSARRREKLDRYQAMQKQVRAWKAPKELAALKRVMLSQLDENLKFDCPPVGEAPKRMTAAEYIAMELGFLTNSAQHAVIDSRNRRRRRKKHNAAIRAMQRELARMDPPSIHNFGD